MNARGRLIIARAVTALLVVSELFSLTGCLFNKKKSTDGRGEGSTLFDRKSFVISRSSGGTVASVQFTATIPVMCSFDIYAQAPDREPKAAAPRTVPCAAAQPSAAIKESIPNLEPDVLYFFRVTAWRPESTKDKGEILVVRESPSGSEASVLVEPDGKFRDIMVGRMDVPLRTTEIHRHSFGNPTSSQDLRGIVARPSGCKGGVLPSPGANLQAAEQDLRAANIATRGFASGASQPHINYRERAKILTGNLQFADRWEWVFDIFGKSQNFFAKAPARLQSIDITSTSALALRDSRLREEEEPILKIDSSKPLQVKWRAEGLTDPSSMIVQVGRGEAGTFHCVFDPSSGAGTVEPTLLAAMTPGKHAIIATLESNQILVAQNTGAWLIVGNDFKSGILER